jgi:hypothetical protein
MQVPAPIWIHLHDRFEQNLVGTLKLETIQPRFEAQFCAAEALVRDGELALIGQGVRDIRDIREIATRCGVLHLGIEVDGH